MASNSNVMEYSFGMLMCWPMLKLVKYCIQFIHEMHQCSTISKIAGLYSKFVEKGNLGERRLLHVQMLFA